MTDKALTGPRWIQPRPDSTSDYDHLLYVLVARVDTGEIWSMRTTLPLGQ